MRKPILVLALVLLAAVPAFGQWQPADIRISETTDYCYTTAYGGWSIACDTNDVHIVYRQYYYPRYNASYVGFPIGEPPGTPPAPTQINNAQIRCNYPCISAVGDGSLHTDWDYSYVNYFRPYNGSSWGSIESHGQGEGNWQPYAPAICSDADGNCYSVYNNYYYQRSPRRYYRDVWFQRRTAGGSWSHSNRIYRAPLYPSYYYYSYYPSICMTPNGDLHVSVVARGGQYRPVHIWSTDGGNSWDDEYVNGNNTAYYSYPTSICSDKDGNVYIAYNSYDRRNIFVASNVNGGWENVNVSNEPSNYSYNASICCDTFGNIWLAWHDRRGGSDYAIFTSTLPFDGEFTDDWSTPLQTSHSTDDAYRAQIAADPHGNVHLCWYDRRHYGDGYRYEIYYNWYSPPTGGPTGELDLIMEQIIRPYTTEEAGAAFNPACRIWQNLEDTTIDAEVLCRIRDMETMSTVYEDVLAVYPLDHGYNEVSAFRAFTPEGSKEYEAFFVVNHPDDIDVSNNDMNKRFNTEAVAQVDPIEIPVPGEGEAIDKMNPNANFKNIGTEVATDFYCYCEILSEDAYATADYIDSFAVASLDPEATTDVMFAEWLCDDSSVYVARFFAAVPAAERELIGEEEFVSFQGVPWTGIGEGPVTFGLEAITPNPFTGSASVNFSVPKAVNVSLKVYDVTGKLIETLADETFTAGSHTVNWTAEAAPGVYFVRFTTLEFNACEKVTLIR